MCQGPRLTADAWFSCRSNYTPKDEGGIPTGEVSPVEGTSFDFTESRRIGNSIDQVEGGYDHNYILFGMGKNAKFATTVGAAALQCDSAPGNAPIISFALRLHKQGPDCCACARPCTQTTALAAVTP